MISSRFHIRTLAALTLLLAVSLVGTTPFFAHADEDNLDALQAQVEHTAQAYNNAQQALATLNATIQENQQHLDQIAEQLPSVQAAAANAICADYKMQQNANGLLSLVLDSENFEQFIASCQYIFLIQAKNSNSLATLTQTKSDLEKIQHELAQQKAAVEVQEQEAKAAMDAAKQARQQAQAKAAERSVAELPTDTSSPGTVDWSQDKREFVNTWHARIDNYLAGSPMAGCGQTYAAAAWDYGVDPRFSPAISAVESSKGAACCNPHNAWGWGNASWSSWEEAIYAHVSGLAHGYGSNLSYSAAQKYCPPDPTGWYNKVLAQMNSI